MCYRCCPTNGFHSSPYLHFKSVCSLSFFKSNQDSAQNRATEQVTVFVAACDVAACMHDQGTKSARSSPKVPKGAAKGPVKRLQRGSLQPMGSHTNKSSDTLTTYSLQWQFNQNVVLINLHQKGIEKGCPCLRGWEYKSLVALLELSIGTAKLQRLFVCSHFSSSLFKLKIHS